MHAAAQSQQKGPVLLLLLLLLLLQDILCLGALARRVCTYFERSAAAEGKTLTIYALLAHITLSRSFFGRFGHIIHQNDLKFGADFSCVVRFKL